MEDSSLNFELWPKCVSDLGSWTWQNAYVQIVVTTSLRITVAKVTKFKGPENGKQLSICYNWQLERWFLLSCDLSAPVAKSLCEDFYKFMEDRKYFQTSAQQEAPPEVMETKIQTQDDDVKEAKTLEPIRCAVPDIAIQPTLSTLTPPTPQGRQKPRGVEGEGGEKGGEAECQKGREAGEFSLAEIHIHKRQAMITSMEKAETTLIDGLVNLLNDISLCSDPHCVVCHCRKELQVLQCMKSIKLYLGESAK